jgi:UDP-glucose 4-epimerase
VPENPKNADKYEIFFGDITDKKKVREACEGVDYILHLAALDRESCKKNPELALKVNETGTRIVLEAAKDAHVKKFIYMSTLHVYGKLEGRVTEETPTDPIDDYGITKLKGEYYCRQFDNDTKCLIIRLSNAYGAPLTNAGRNLVVNDFCRQSVEKQKIILKSDGKQKRDFIAISDICQAIKVLLHSELKDKKKNIFNVGGDKFLSIRELAELVGQIYLEVYGAKVEIGFDKNLIKEQSTYFLYDISRIKKLGFQPKAKIKEEIKETFKVFDGGNVA